MLSEERIRIMTEMALFEQDGGKQKLKISSYFRRDYAGFKAIATLLWILVAFALGFVLYIILNFEELIDHLTMDKIIHIGIRAGIVLLALLVVYIVITYIIYSRRHRNAVRDVKEYYALLRRLERLYNRDNKDRSLQRTLVDWEETER